MSIGGAYDPDPPTDPVLGFGTPDSGVGGITPDGEGCWIPLASKKLSNSPLLGW